MQTKCQGIVGVYAGSDGKSVYSGALRCNKWTCPFCAPKKLKQLQSRLYNGSLSSTAISKYGLKFVTLTFGGINKRADYRVRSWEHDFDAVTVYTDVDGNNQVVQGKQVQTGPYLTWSRYDPRLKRNVTAYIYDLKRMYEDMMDAFNRLRTALVKRYGKFLYFRIYEPHKDGVPHIHVLFAGNSIIPRSFREAVEHLWHGKYQMGFVRVNTIKDKNGRPITLFNDANHAINYMLKYLTKDITSAGRYKRVFSCSQGALIRLQKKDYTKMIIVMGSFDDNGNCVEELIQPDTNTKELIDSVLDVFSGSSAPDYDRIEDAVIFRHLRRAKARNLKQDF